MWTTTESLAAILSIAAPLQRALTSSPLAADLPDDAVEIGLELGAPPRARRRPSRGNSRFVVEFGDFVGEVLIGCGRISGKFATISTASQLELRGITGIFPEIMPCQPSLAPALFSRLARGRRLTHEPSPAATALTPAPTVALHLHDYTADLDRPAPLRPRARRHHALARRRDPLPLRVGDPAQHLCIHFAPPRRRIRPRISPAAPFPPRPAVAEARERIWRIIDHHRQAGAREDSPAACAASASLQELLLWLHLQSTRLERPAPRQPRG